LAKTLVEVLTEQGVETFESSNGRRVAHCPFHEGDRSPSFVVYPNETYYCFGCQVWGNPVKFLVDYKGMSGKEALEYVGVDYELPKSEKRVIKVKNTTKTATFLYDVSLKYHNYLVDTPGPMKYLIERGLTKQTVERYLIGYTDGGVLDFKFAHEYEMANEVGLLNKSGYESMSHRIVIPSLVGDLVDFMIGRTVINDKVKYLGLRMPKPMMGFYDVRFSPIVFLVEGQFDWLLLRQWDYPSIVMSGSHLTKANINLLRDRIVVYIPDNDDTGAKAASKVKSSLPNSLILDTSSLNAKDISETATREHARTTFDNLVREQLWDILSSNPTLEKYLPISIYTTHLLSI
jgi:DNA primase